MDNLDNNDTILLLKACKENCKKSTESLYIKFKSETGNKSHNSRSKKDLDDSIQELFVRILDKKLNYKQKGNSKAFLRKTIKNIQLEQFNSNKLKHQSLQDMESNGIFLPDNHTYHPLKALENEEVKQIIMKAISELPTKSQQAIELVYLDGIPAKQAAESISCEFRIFRNRLKYALKILKEKLYIY
jgi:RNA polymerase sigma factor (sigma-70 family)